MLELSNKHVYPLVVDDIIMAFTKEATEFDPVCIQDIPKAYYDPKSQKVLLRTEEEQDAFIYAEQVKNTLSLYEQQLDAYLDSVARQRRYDDKRLCMIRAGYPGPFHDEAAAFATWADQCYATCYLEMNKIVLGERELPELFDEILQELPTLVWPDQNTTTA